ncbi:N2,N2-dimethylguanosine tRNA methyltransferase [Polychytrium aggregatum]|uniref:N2,N2-dimethylguanosine tRNA methyltransferase n=1 Tax=Polychytrium aggregatum TaxID=110093 RepID=UPI0022FE6EF1|nr:N2,N2-dimethylguanosine tRNA methyltransferase [Polychytrium aggregatum]KAI9205119.1 N2,N2-dimethylguanosine tRNA methyltransferase [Polychytrium aggregatum]
MGEPDEEPSQPTFEQYTTADGLTAIKEGQAEILFSNANDVFYNPVQEFNRDMSVAAINVWSEMYLQEKREAATATRKRKQDQNAVPLPVPDGVAILEGLSATGLRSIRYAKEIPNAKSITANDFDANAVETIKRNVNHNGCEDKIIPSLGDACAVMYQKLFANEKYDMIDLDPYGSAAPFIDAAVQAVADGGLLAVTCTDMAVLAGSQPDSCWAKYGGMPIPNAPYCHEMGLRIALHTIQTSAARHKRYIVPLASCSIDFYIRMFVRVYTSPQEVKKLASKTAMVYHCNGCRSFVTQPIGKYVENGNSVKGGPANGPLAAQACGFCETKTRIGGPFWAGPLHNDVYLQKVIQHVKDNKDKYKTNGRMLGMLTVISEELETPFYYSLSSLSGSLRCTSPPLLTVFSALLHKGYKVSVSHACSGSIKTNAPTSVVWDVMRGWVKFHPVKTKSGEEQSVSAKLLAVEPSFEANFEPHPEMEAPSRKIKLVRYQVNPTKNWGPKARAKKRAIDEGKNDGDAESDQKKQP